MKVGIGAGADVGMRAGIEVGVGMTAGCGMLDRFLEK